jgi:hypothetical protein
MKLFKQLNIQHLLQLKTTGFVLLGFAIFSLANCTPGSGSHTQKITLQNTSGIALSNKAVVIKREALHNIPANAAYPMLVNAAGDTLAIQADDTDGDKKWDELFFIADIPAQASETFTLSWTDTPHPFEKKTSIRLGVRPDFNSKVALADSAVFYANQLPGVIGYQPFQTDGPTWENDKVAFRIYLDGRNSIDVFGKKTAAITPENVGLSKDGVTEVNYSTMQPWGMDILAVGNSVGIGGISFLIGDSLCRLGVTEQDTLNNVEVTTCKILTKGPVRSMLQFDYNNWKPATYAYTVQTKTSTWPGMHAFANEVICKNCTANETLVVGLVNSKTTQPLTVIEVNEKWIALLTHDKQTVDTTGWLGLALLLPKAGYNGYIEAPKTGKLSSTWLGKLKIEKNKPVQYFAIAAWEGADAKFKDKNYFVNYVKNLADQLATEVKISIE